MALLTASFFPFSNILQIILLRGDSVVSASSKSGMVADIFARYLRYSSFLFLSMLAFRVLPHPGERAGVWAIDWMLIVILRNLAIVHVTYGGFQFILYDCHWTRSKVRSQKFWPANIQADGNLDVTKGYDPVRDRRLTSVGVIVASLLECCMLHLWATGGLRTYNDFFSEPIRSFALVAVLPYWADFHFFFVHRVLHPWCPSRLGRFDVGKWLYQHVHKVHHKSYNTGPWTGLAMHPVEQLLFFSSVLIPVAQHPLHFYLGLFHKLLAPLAGHDGFADPGGDGYFHFLHHKHFEVNFGSPAVPLDKLFGSFSDGSEFRK